MIGCRQSWEWEWGWVRDKGLHSNCNVEIRQHNTVPL